MNNKIKPWLCTLCVLLLCYLSYSFMNDLFISKEASIAILGFHHVAPDKEKENNWSNEIWTDSLSGFEEKIKYLYENGYHSVSLEDVYEWRFHGKELDEKAVVLTFDDGYDSTSELIAPILEKYGFIGSAFVIGSIVTEDDVTYDPNQKLPMSIEDMKDQSIMKYYTHFYDMHYKDDAKAAITFKSSQEIFEDLKLASQTVSTEFVAYPYGIYDDHAKDAVKQYGVKLAFGFNENRKAKLSDDPYALPRFSVNSYTTIDILKAMLESK